MSAAPDRPFGGEPPAWDRLPHGPMSLWDMINFSLHDFVWTLKLLSQEIGVAARHPNPQDTLSDADKERVVNFLKFTSGQCSKLLLNNADNRLGRIFTEIESGIRYVMLANELMVLAEAIEDDIKTEYFYHYLHQKGVLVLRVPGDWASTIKAFPSAKPEIDDAVDCYALGHSTASVFHLMRVAEYGLRALARERQVILPKGKPIEWGTWQDIMKEIDDSVKAIGRTAPAGPGKDAALSFYSGALGHFHAFKDTYRNMVMHVRKRYEDLEAEIALNHVRDFMNGMSLRINEKQKASIRWKF